jgi:enoyl-CoA hydratase
MAKGTIDLSYPSDRLAWIRINNPSRHNAMSLGMWQDLDRRLCEIMSNSAARAVIISGEGGKAFMSGADISEFPDQRNTVDIGRIYDTTADHALNRLRHGSIPSIAMIEGYCIGGGILLALACDLRYASETANFRIPAARMGLAYDFPATKDLIDAVGGSTTKEMLYTARSYSAGEARSIGLVNDVFESDALESSVRKLAEDIARNAPLTIKAAKGIVRELLEPGSPDGNLCQALADACYQSEDYKEGYTAFLEKRMPDFLGR